MEVHQRIHLNSALKMLKDTTAAGHGPVGEGDKCFPIGLTQRLLFRLGLGLIRSLLQDRGQ